MRDELSAHPLLAPFRRSKSDSLTLNDFTYRLRLDDDGAAELEEQEFYRGMGPEAPFLRGATSSPDERRATS